MKETDDLEFFLVQLEIALKSGGVDRARWKHHMLTQLTVKAKEPVVFLVEDDLIDYDDVKEALFSRHIMSHAAAAEAFYSLDNRQLLDVPVARW